MKRVLALLVLVACGSDPPPPTTPLAAAPLASTVSDQQASQQANLLASMDGGVVGVVAAPSASAKQPSSAEVDVGAATQAGGSADPQMVARALAGLRPRFRACYMDGLKQDPRIKAELTLSFVIDAKGDASNVTQSGATLPADVLACVEHAIERTKFPVSKKAATVTLPVTFRS